MNRIHPMKALIGREVREHVRVTLLGTMILVILLGVQFVQLWNIDGIVQQQPLLIETHQAVVLIYCGVFGTLLGWFQARSERRRDLWAFLMHRPISRTRIFFAKLMAGVALYTIGIGVPLLVYVFWIRFGGRVAAPFEWAMALPWVANLLAGMLCIAAAMVLAIRRARWFGSRTLILAAIGPMLLFVHASEFWMVFAIWILFAGVLGLAAWGAYVGLGEDSDLPLMGRVGMVVSFLAGSIVPVVLVVSGLVVMQQVFKPFFGGTDNWMYERYVVTTNGTPYIMVLRSSKAPEFLHLDRTSVAGSGTNNLQSHIAPRLMTSVGKVAQYASLGYRDSGRYHIPITFPNGSGAWYWTRHGEVIGYDFATGQVRGSFTPGQPGEQLKPTDLTFLHRPSDAHLYLCSETAVYRLESEMDGPIEVYRSTGSDPVISALDVPVIQAGGRVVNALVVVSKRGICMIDSEGDKVWEVPFELDAFDPGQIEFYSLADERTALLVSRVRQYPITGTDVTDRLMVVSHASGLEQSLDLETLKVSHSSMADWQVSIVKAMNGVLVGFGVNQPKPYQWFSANPWVVLWVGLGWLAGRRQGLSMPKQLGWAVFHLATGLPGLLASLSIGNWPVMIPCHKCGRSRSLEESKCRSCGAGSPLTEPDGTEIFEAA